MSNLLGTNYNELANEIATSISGTPQQTTVAPALLDAFGRQRVSNPLGLISQKLIVADKPLFWDDQEVSGSGTTSVHDANNASMIMSVSDTTAGKRVRQTFQRADYQPGKSQLILVTAADILTTAGITKGLGYGDDNNGLFLQNKDGVASFVVRSFTSGAVVDTVITQANWNVDKMDGTGASGITLDFTKNQILYMDFEWLGVGTVAFGFVVDRVICIAHLQNHANIGTTVYISNPNLPIRYWIENDGTGAASSLRAICSAVNSEGGQDDTGFNTSIETFPAHIDADTIDAQYAILGIRLKPMALGCVVTPLKLTVISETNDDFGWKLLFNPVINNAPPVWTGLTNSALEWARGAGGLAGVANTITVGVNEGHVLDSGVAQSNASIETSIDNSLRIGASIAGVPDTIWLAVTPFGSNADIQATFRVKEK